MLEILNALRAYKANEIEAALPPEEAERRQDQGQRLEERKRRVGVQYEVGELMDSEYRPGSSTSTSS